MQLKEINKGTSLQKIALILRLKEETNTNTILGASIVESINSNTPVNEVLNFVKEQGKDNSKLMETVIGKELTEQILSL